jgi:hypothetical protein
MNSKFRVPTIGTMDGSASLIPCKSMAMLAAYGLVGALLLLLQVKDT